MKKFLVLLAFLGALSSQCWCSSSLSSTEKEELTAIINELETLTKEQEKIIESLKQKNSELENSLKSQEQKLNELETLSKDKMMIIGEQRKTIDEQKSLLEKPRTSWEVIVNGIVAAIATFFGGFFVGKILF